MDFQTLANTKDMSRHDWLQLRREGIGGSEIATIVLGQAWANSSRYSVWADKVGITPIDENEPENHRYKMGHLLEPVIAQLFLEKTGIRIKRRNAIMQSKKWPFLLANIDREAIGTRAGIELKTTDPWSADEWKGGQLPDKYYLQCQHYMAVTGWPTWYIASVIGFNDFIVHEIPRSEETIQLIVERGAAFWELVKTKTPPEVDSSEATAQAMKYQYKNPVDDTIQVPETLAIWGNRLNQAKLAAAEAEAIEKEAKARIREALRDHVAGAAGDMILRRKVNTEERFDSAAFRREHPELYAQYRKPIIKEKFEAEKIG